jgi:hypothetical protein
MEQITNKFNNIILNNFEKSLPVLPILPVLPVLPVLPGSKIKLKDNNTSYIFIGYTVDNKYVIINETDKQIYKNTIICSSIENII